MDKLEQAQQNLAEARESLRQGRRAITIVLRLMIVLFALGLMLLCLSLTSLIITSTGHAQVFTVRQYFPLVAKWDLPVTPAPTAEPLPTSTPGLPEAGCHLVATAQGNHGYHAEVESPLRLCLVVLHLEGGQTMMWNVDSSGGPYDVCCIDTAVGEYYYLGPGPQVLSGEFWFAIMPE